MGAVILLDTNALVYWGQGRLPEPTPGDYLVTSVICEIELLSWPELSDDDEAMAREILAAVTVLPLDESVKDETIRIRRATRLRLPDALVAATARSVDAAIWTYDNSFQRVEGIRVVSPPLLSGNV